MLPGRVDDGAQYRLKTGAEELRQTGAAFRGLLDGLHTQNKRYADADD